MKQAELPGADALRGECYGVKGQGPLFDPVAREAELRAQGQDAEAARQEAERRARERTNARRQMRLS